jgi:uncharacterized protein YbaR (Trm112 family)
MSESSRPAVLGIPAELWDVLACPCPDHAPLDADPATGRIVCTVCHRSFEVRDGIPVMLLDEAESPSDPTDG